MFFVDHIISMNEHTHTHSKMKQSELREIGNRISKIRKMHFLITRLLGDKNTRNLLRQKHTRNVKNYADLSVINLFLFFKKTLKKKHFPRLTLI